LIRERFGVRYHEGHVWKLLRALRWSPQRPVGKARERNEQAIREWKHVTWPAIKKSPKTRPHDRLRRRKRTEPEAASLPHLGAARPNAGARVQLQLEETFGGGRHHLPQLLLPALRESHGRTGGDRLPQGSDAAHWRAAVDRLGPAAGPQEPLGARVHRLLRRPHRPGYAPELNPVEYIWGYWKQHELPNVCPKDYWELDARARQALRRMRRKPRLVAAFWKQSSLCLG
jgi:hypothetical protein